MTTFDDRVNEAEELVRSSQFATSEIIARVSMQKVTLKVRSGPQPSRRQPSGGRGIYLHHHAHVWQEHGTVDHPNGATSVCWRCAICTDIIYADVAARTEGEKP